MDRKPMRSPSPSPANGRIPSRQGRGILNSESIKIRNNVKKQLQTKKLDRIRNISKKYREIINNKIIDIKYGRYSSPVKLKINNNEYLKISWQKNISKWI